MIEPPESERLRVLHLASGDAWGGAERVTSLLIEGLRAHPDVAVGAVLLNDGRLASVLRGLGIQVEVIPEEDHSFFALARSLRRKVRRDMPNLLHVHRYKELILGALARSARPVGLVSTVHGLEPADQLARTRRILLWGSGLIGRAAGARFVAVSPEIERRLRAVLGASRVTRIPNPMPNPAPTPDLHSQHGSNPERPRIGFVGRLEHVKGPDLFLDLAEIVPDAHFVVVGSGPLREKLESRAESCLPGRIHFTGSVEDALPYLCTLDVLVLPSRHEGTPMVLLEAASVGVPAVAFDVGGVGAVLDGAPKRWLAPSGDVPALARAVAQVLGSPVQARRDAMEWRSAVLKEHALSTVVKAYVDLYRTVGRWQP